jgi:hypothetical protein
LGAGSKLVSLDRTTLTAPRAEHFPSNFAMDPVYLHTAGEGIFGSREFVNTRGGRVVHDTAVAGPTGSVSVAGVAAHDTASDGSRLYMGARGQGDVFGRDGEGIITRVSATGRSQTVLATQQNVAGVTVAGANVYWIDFQSAENAAGDHVGVIRFRTK